MTEKRTLILSLLGTLLFFSCSLETEVPSIDERCKDEIYFGVKEITTTKAVKESSISDIESDGFKAAVIIDESSNVIFNEVLTYRHGTYSAAEETYYYPESGTVSAYAVYPQTEDIEIQDNEAFIRYSQDCDRDLIVAKAKGVSKQKAAIRLEFQHPLSCVDFQVKGRDEYVDYILKLIEIAAPQSGTYRYESDDWDEIGEAANYTVFSDEGTSISTDGYQPVGESLTFIPGEISIRVVWECRDKDTGERINEYDQSISTTLSQGEYSTLNLILPTDETLYLTRALVFSSPTAAAIGYRIAGSPGEINLEYSKDAVEWTSWNGSNITFGAGVKLYIRGKNPTGISKSPDDYLRFTITGSNVRCTGDIMTLIDYDEEITTIPCDYCFHKLFTYCEAIIQAPKLSATTIKPNCYNQMFSSCRSLTHGPELPATSLADYCYAYMFANCSSLTQIPTMFATTLAPYCCYQMFGNCTSLTEAPSLPATTLAPYCYYRMFYNCTSLVDAPILPATEMVDYCYLYMFQGCTSLINAPALPSTGLATYCYSDMFQDCTSLMHAPSLPATELANYCYYKMFEGCTSLTQAPELPATNLETRCYSKMFIGCTSLSEAPALPALIAKGYCYASMFDGCTSLTKAPELPAIILASRCYEQMFNGCTALVSAPVLPATTLISYCYNEMFNGCTQLNSITMLATSLQSNTCLTDWVVGVSPTGTFTKAASMTTLPTGTSGIPDGWNVVSK